MDSEELEYSYDHYIYLDVNGMSYPMLKCDYDNYIKEGLKNPVLIGNEIYMVNNKDYKLLKKIEKLNEKNIKN